MDEYVLEALRAGAAGFLVKDIQPEDFLHSIRVAARGDALLAPSITRRLIDRYVTQPLTASGTDLEELTPANARPSPWSPGDCPTTRSPPAW